MAQGYFGPDYSMVRRRAAQAGTGDEQRSILPVAVPAPADDRGGSMFSAAPSYARPRGMGQFLGGGEAPTAGGPGLANPDPMGGDSGPGDPGTPSGIGPSGGSIFGGSGGPSGRGILSALAMAGYVFPNPVSTAAGIANGVMSWGNMNNLDATRSAYGFPELNFGQRAGGVLGFNGYGRSSTLDDFNNQMAQAISRGQPVTVPSAFGGVSVPGIGPSAADVTAANAAGLDIGNFW